VSTSSCPDLDEDTQPWERRGAVRKDCTPHRGRLLLSLSGLGALCCLFLVQPLGLSLCLAVWLCAGRDLARMRDGRMDRGGRQAVKDARACAAAGVVATAVYLFGGVAVYLLLAVPVYSTP
jgi:hypothetical protein